MARDGNEVDANLKGIDASGEEHQLLTDTQGRLLLGGGVAPAGVATSANQTNGSQVAKVHGSVAEGAAIPAPVVAGGKDAAGNSLALDNTADGLSVRQADATKFKNTEANSGAIKTAVELIDDAVATIGAVLGTVKGLAILGSDGANWRALLTNAAGNLIPKSPTAADFKVEEASAAAILANQTNGTQVAKTHLELKRIAVTTATDDGTAITLATGVNNGHWGLVCIRALQSIGTSTTSRYAIGEDSGFAAGDIDTVEQAASATAKGALINDNFVQPIPCQADGSGNLYLLSGRDANDDSTFDVVVTLVKYSAA